MTTVQHPLLPMPGELIDGQYRVRDFIGRGGMGVVLLATDERLERDVAIKTVRPDILGNAVARDRFLKEARALARVSHPNVTRIHAFGELEGMPYFVMEHVPGKNLDELLLDGWFTGRPVEDTLQILHQVCAGLAAIHGAGLVHGDVKPSNVIVSRNGRIVLTDMGLARMLAGPDVDNGGTWGTPEYIAPELVRGKPMPPHLLPRADVYSLAVIAFELLTGRLPFESDDRDQIPQMHLNDPAPLVSHYRRDLTAAFDSVILRALEKDPRWRTPTAPRFSEMLDRALRRARTGRVRFLIADDNPDQRALLSELLARKFTGAVIEAVPDGAAALAVAERTPPTVAIIDLDMPGMNGVELAAALRGREDTRNTAIVVMTGVGASGDWQALQRMGVEHFVLKPAVPSHLVSLLTELSERAQTPRPRAAAQ